MRKEKTAVLITCSVKTQEFESNYERSKFFRALYGWKQIVPNEKDENKEYVYERECLLDEMPHEKVDQSSFIILEDNFDRIEKFFEEWANKVIWKNFKVLLNKDMEEMFEEFEEAEEDE